MVPIPKRARLQKSILIEKTELLCRRMRWRAFFYLNPNINNKNHETYGFNSKRTPPQIPQMLNFENRLINMIENIKFRNNKCRFQSKLSSDVNNYTKKSSELLVSADKTTNFYRMSEASYNDLLHKNITKTYKKVSPTVASSIENKTKTLVEKLHLADRINITAKRDAFITLKDHKPNFANNPTCRLINPTKSEIGKISKQILDRINKNVINNLKLNQWKNTSAVLNWFNNIQNKSKYSFIAFDVVDFYLSISIDLLNAALDFAESCELVGSFLLHNITQKYGNNFGLYRDDGLGIIKGSPRQIELTKKDLCAIFNEHGLKITIEANKKCVDFLDITLNLSTGKHMSYTKPNNAPLYIHTKSNHPPTIIKNLPESINKRPSDISSDKESFDRAATPYQRALNHSGYNYQLNFRPSTSPNIHASQKKRRHRNITWYNPPYSKSVATNIGRTFLQILDEEFHKNHVLHKVFNRNTVKISYACMPNIKQTIDGHNKSILMKFDKPKTDECNCRKRKECPLLGQCLTKSIIYQATVTTNDNKPDQTYVGLTSNAFKTRFNNHKNSFKYRRKKHSTELSNYVWDLKDNNVDFNIIWKILKQANPYNNTSNRCNLCLREKYFIICKPSLASLNKRNELVSSCRHVDKFLIKNL